MEKRLIYADNAATTPVSAEVLDAMLPYFKEGFGNPSSLYSKGREAKRALDDARARVAAVLGCDANEVYFTSGGTEADNWAIRGTMAMTEKRHVITTKIEHPAVLRTCEALEKKGCRVSYVGVGSNGIVDPAEIEKEITSDTALIAVMMANNEIGTIQPIAEIAKIAHAHGVRMFTDAVQAVGAIPVNVRELDVDLLSLSGHKLHAPKGIGVLYVKRGTRLDKLITGGGQERAQRSGTESVASIVGLARAMEIAAERLPDMERVRGMRDRLIDHLIQIPYAHLNGEREHRLPGNVNMAFEFIEGESMLLLLDMQGICVSTGSACSSNSLEPSHVLLAIGVPEEKAHGSVRISLSHDNTDADVDEILRALPKVVDRLRAMSPIYPGDPKETKA